MKILYISSVPSKKQFDYMKSKLKKSINTAKYGMQESGFKFHHLIIEGIISNPNNFVYSLIGRPTSIKEYDEIVWKRYKENYGNVCYDHIGYLNLPIIKNIIISVSYFFKTLKWIGKNKNEEKCIILDASYITVIPFINLATKLRKCSKVAIVCDIYEYMADVKDAREKSSKKHKLISKFMSNSYKKMDGFVLLTEAMNSVINKQNKPYIVMEGLVDSNMVETSNTLENKYNKNVAIYAGAIRAQYGLKNLIEGFHDYKNDNSELWIYGAGDYVPEVEKICKVDSRIKYFGIVPNSKVVIEETKATLLVNPRPVNQEFTKYSFPSKNMEYMVSGTPILTTKLPGMPNEYYDYLYLIDGNSKKDITDSLDKVFKLNKNDLHKKGLEAKNFVLKNKSNVVQAKRILNLCKGVIQR